MGVEGNRHDLINQILIYDLVFKSRLKFMLLHHLKLLSVFDLAFWNRLLILILVTITIQCQSLGHILVAIFGWITFVFEDETIYGHILVIDYLGGRYQLLLKLVMLRVVLINMLCDLFLLLNVGLRGVLTVLLPCCWVWMICWQSITIELVLWFFRRTWGLALF